MFLPALLLAAPGVAHACAMCFSGSVRVRMAFFATTVLLSLLPLGLITAGLLYLRRAAAGEFEERGDWEPGAR